jgi:hypothetical protein
MKETANEIKQQKGDYRHLGDAGHATDISESLDKFRQNGDQGPIRANTSSVRRTQKSGEESLQSRPRKRCP